MTHTQNNNNKENPDELGVSNENIDSNFDPEFVSEEEENNPQQVIKDLRKKLKDCQKESMENLSGWQRAKADFVNAKKQSEEEKKRFIEFAEERLMDGLLPVLQSFEMAMSNKESWESAPKEWRVGMEYIYSQLLKVLTDRGLQEINPTKEDFNPSLHEAVGSIEVDKENDDHRVLEVLQKGYMLGDKILRPARVKIGKLRSQI